MEELSNINKFQFFDNCINKFPSFSGNTTYLAHFINRIDSISDSINELPDNYSTLLFNSILDKITGQARVNVLAKGNVSDWNTLKQTLLESHGEKTSTSTLIDELVLCRCNSSIKQFYNDITVLLSRINNAFLLRNELTEEQSEINKRIAFKTFVNNLPEPAKGIVLSRNSSTLNECYQVITECGYANDINTEKTNLLTIRSRSLQNLNCYNNNMTRKINNSRQGFNSSNHIFDKNFNNNNYNNNNCYNPNSHINYENRNNYNNNYNKKINRNTYNPNNYNNRVNHNNYNPNIYNNNNNNYNNHNNNYNENRNRSNTRTFTNSSTNMGSLPQDQNCRIPNSIQNSSHPRSYLNRNAEPMDVSTNEFNNEIFESTFQQSSQENFRGNPLTNFHT